MATATVYAVSHVEGNCTAPNNAVGDTPGTWTGNVDNESWTSRWELGGLPGGGVTTGEQTLTILARHDDGDNPTMDVVLFENGVLTQTLATGVAIGSLTGQDVVVPFTPNDPAAVYSIRVQCYAVGGNPATRSSVQLARFTWDAVYDMFEGSTFQAWDGGAWVPGKLKQYDGAAWVPAQVQRWDGGAWVDVP